MVDINRLTRKQLKKKIDDEFSIFIRRRDSDDWTELGNCVTCGQTRHWKKADNGHYITRACLPLRWDEKNNHLQCKGCNGPRDGESVLYRRRLLQMYGQKEVDRLEETYIAWKAGEIPKHTMQELRDLLIHYKELNK